ncbi:MAG: DUF2231 domain-containing protein [Bacteroidota bacterium]
MPLHPALVHFPIALLVVSGGFYVVAVWQNNQPEVPKTAFVLHLLGMIGMVLAIFSGLQAEGDAQLTEEVDAILGRHEILGYGVLWMYGMLYVWHYLRKGKQTQTEKIIFVLVFVGISLAMLYSASLGGELVYQHGIGVDINTP